MANSKHFTRRDFLKLSGTALAAGMLGIRAPRLLADEAVDDSFQAFWHGRRDQAQIALSYDDCHLVKKLQSLEKMLRERPNLKVTFFPTGEALLKTNDKDLGIWQRFVEGGHEIGSHTFDHVNPDVRSTKNLIEDHAKWMAALRQVTESHPPIRFARPPFGSLSPTYREFCIERGLVAVIWSASWGGELTLTQKNIEAVENGDVVLMHTSSQDVDVNSPFAFSLLEERGIRAVTMSELYFASLREQIGVGSCGADSYNGQSCPE
ncbi:MAG: polysaccharide deacetylase family protein [Anaerolineae bacterium]|jgi:peptidoglycan/xylan/chitin deacetylase (PgdA/CDA1 family)|nr:polysaccharide deacetylase family protein [Anaerolineae bacterium]MBT3712057.1 polysaccharide deacetylase family protein [Anaerolineae bacterium]MBT4312084.1 polysaccharide deacetylase family protein [Anaerolineae bacterium]MBT4457135.1 polysaccharide deacetylase family protein [Anaerolineae bacterium]MBT4843108.1 polysaccharide deacetylase family protein [Anaerolineae bacterium]